MTKTTASGENAILVFAGSAREASLNKRLARAAAARLQVLGARATFIDLRDYPMPLYDGDLEAEQGLPEAARALRRLFLAHRGLVVVSPEYNGFITPLMKNTIDWLSRPDGNGDGLAPFRDRIAAVMSASPGGFGGMRSLALIRQLLTHVGVTVLPDQLAVARATGAFSDDGGLVDEAHRERLERLCRRLTDTLARMTD